MFLILINKRTWIICLGVFIIFYFINFNLRIEHIEKSSLQEFDLIFLKGNTLRSKLLFGFTESFEYSHVGIVLSVNGLLMVVHANPDKRKNHRDAVIIDSIDKFIADSSASRCTVLRFTGKFDRLKLKKYIDHHLKERTPFDHDFLISTDESLYCTEFIYKAFLAAGVDLLGGKFDYLKSPIVTGDIILPESIVNSGFFEKIIDVGI